MKKWLLLFLAVFLALPTWWVLAQENITVEITGADASDLPTIRINAAVLDNNNRPLLGLTEENFTIGGDLEGRATIVSVANVLDDSLPFAVVLVIDTSTSMSGAPLQEAKDAASLFVQTIGANDPIAIVSFDSDARLVQDFTTDKALLQAAIDGLFVNGRTALYDAAVLGAEVAANAPVSRRAVILLSDGAEFGGESVNERDAGLATAFELGVPVYTIGLGYGTDRSYLEELAAGTNARNYESPEPEQLTEIYGELASLFRSQYIITLESDIPGDGTTYNFTLQASSPEATSNLAEGSLRAPIPVPIVRFEEGSFAEAISAPTSIVPIVLADQEIASLSATIDGEEIVLSEGAIIIDPASLPPATYTLVVTATDVDGDVGSAEVSFETAALPPTVSLSGLPEGEITEPVTLTVEVESQTPVSTVVYSAGELSGESSDAENNFPFVLDPIEFPAGSYELTVDVSNEGGGTATITAPFTVGIVPPRNIRIEGLEGEISEITTPNIVADTQSGTEISSVSISINGQVVESIDPLLYPAGELPIEVTVTDSNGQSSTETLNVTIAQVAPRIVIGEIPDPVRETVSIVVQVISQSQNATVSYGFDESESDTVVEINDFAIEFALEINVESLDDGLHILGITATDENGLDSTETVEFRVALPPTSTPTANASQTAEAELNAQATVQEQATALAETAIAATVAAETSEALQATLDANATRVFEDEATREADSTIEAGSVRATSEAQATIDAAPTETDTAEPTVAPSETDTAEPTVAPTDTATDEPTIAPTDTPEPTIAPTDTATDEPTVAPTNTAEPTEETEVAVVPSETATITQTPPPTSAPTLTPIGEIIEVEAQEAPPVEGNLTTLFIICGGGLLLLILLALVFFGRQRRSN